VRVAAILCRVDFAEATCRYVVNKAAHGYVLPQEWRPSIQLEVLTDGAIKVGEGMELDVAGACAEFLFQLATQVRLVHARHPAFGVVDDRHLRGADNVLADDEAADGINKAPAGIAHDMRVAGRDAQRADGVDSRIHAEDEGDAGRACGHRYEVRGEFTVGGEKNVDSCHVSIFGRDGATLSAPASDLVDTLLLLMAGVGRTNR
jgi:hypothetical protein